MAEQTKQPAAAGNNDNVMAAVATIPLVGLIMYLAMPDASAIVKNYAKQSNFLLAMGVLSMVLSMTGIGVFISCPLSIVSLVAWVILIVKAFQGEANYKLPVVGEFFDGLMK
jgi:uncharacterized membrane protein